MSFARVDALARAVHLDIFGALHPTPEDDLAEDIRTVVLLGPREPGFWAHVSAEPEFSDGSRDAIDRWSARVIGGIADELGGEAFFPFGGPPWRPFIGWAQRSGHAWASEVGILVHDRAGLMVSYRGAVGLRDRLDLPPSGRRPCDSCDEKPCISACPAFALTSQGYDIPACKDYLQTEPGKDCMEAGCQVRRACPLSKSYGRLPEQSAYHMSHFAR